MFFYNMISKALFSFLDRNKNTKHTHRDTVWIGLPLYLPVEITGRHSFDVMQSLLGKLHVSSRTSQKIVCTAWYAG